MLGLLFLGAAEVVGREGTAMSGPLFARFTSPAGYSAGQEAIGVALLFGLKQGVGLGAMLGFLDLCISTCTYTKMSTIGQLIIILVNILDSLSETMSLCLTLI